MNPEEKKMLQETYELSKENYRLLRKIRRSMAWSNFLQILYWAAIIGLPIVLYYYFLQPYVGQFFNYYQQVQSGGDALQNISEQVQQNPSIGSLLKNLGL